MEMAKGVKGLSLTDRTILDRLLTKLAGWVGGAIDTWSLLCISNMVPDLHNFLLEKCRLTRSLVDVTRLLLAEAGLVTKEPARALLPRLVSACNKLQDALLILEKFRTASLEEVQRATVALAEVRGEFLQAVQELGRGLGVEVAYLQGDTSKREEYFRYILENLCRFFQEARATGQPPKALQMPSEIFQSIVQRLKDHGVPIKEGEK